jgi:glycosyltransferase involved in cell wall biosynthesis
LSYGDDDYRKIVVETGKQLFGEHFIAITDYQPKEQYFNTLKSSKLYINNSIIQQGVGNIVVAAYLGVPVVLNAKSEVYDYLVSIGVRCFTIEKDLDTLLSDHQVLTDDENLRNRKAIESVYGEEEVKRRIAAFLDQFGKH